MPRQPSPRPLPSAPPGGPPAAPKPGERLMPLPGPGPAGGILPPPQLTPIDVEKQQLYSQLLPDVCLPLETLPEPKTILGLDGEVLAWITHRTQAITLVISGNHREQIYFFLIRSSSSPGVLGSPWLALHNPQFDWPTGRQISWSVNCHTNCLRSAVTSSSGTSVPAQEIPDLSQVPREYHDLGEVFCKQRALSLPPHRPYDCAIYLLPGAEWKTAFKTPLGHFKYLVMLFGLTNGPRRNLRRSTSSMSGWFSNGSWRTDFSFKPRNTNSTPAPSPSWGSWWRRDSFQKTQARQLQQFRGFANSYLLTRLTSTLLSFRWTPETETAFNRLKGLFSSSPILTHPDPSRQFVVEVDASDVGVGAVLSQRSREDQKLHMCAFFHRLSPAERNNDVGNKELLAVVLALQEWRHWLEGATQPFIIWTDYKNLKYLRNTKRLNSRQFASGMMEVAPDPILPPSCILGAPSWLVEERVREAQHSVPDPGEGLLNRLFVPEGVQSDVLQWARASKLTF
ncbi:Retrovirus-related Pol polyprotein from transposon 17.6 [Takifugu flavidus]|uniref:Retrovirus-related Pol polyprotein from transposon 17.6 n=1 Tax=Takifugu flavidus TaxID=433684 RepID=A0A5C6PN04_9TELE|nr:Retrovirus-related Pol polyprotein from transposon 17.6 [Takifugu flavidus]